MNLSHTELELDLGPVAMNCSAEEVAAVFAGLLREMRAAAPFIRPDERDVLRRILAHDGGTLTVADVFPDFARDSDALTTLRKLRTAQFIRPAGRDMWERGERIDVRPFARLVWDRLGEAAVFGDDSDDTPAPSEDIDLALPGADDTAKAKSPAGKWDDDDVLDFLNDEAKK
jgi:hypothetical protein